MRSARLSARLSRPALASALLLFAACSDSGDGPAPAPLIADAGESLSAFVDTTVILDGSASVGAVQYQWNFGDGRGWDSPRETPVAEVIYTEPGRYQAVLTVFDASGFKRSASVSVSVLMPSTFEPSTSSSIIRVDDARYAVVSPDSDAVVLLRQDGEDFSVEARVPVPGEPRRLCRVDRFIAVTSWRGGTLTLVDPDQPGASAARHDFGYGSLPFGMAEAASLLWVTLQGPGVVVGLEVDADSGELREAARFEALADARAIAALPDDRLVVSRWRSGEAGGVLSFLDPAGGTRQERLLPVSQQASSDTEMGGVPTYLEALVVSPNARQLAVPALLANIVEGEHRNGVPLTNESAVRAMLAWVDLNSGEERLDARRQFDDRGFAAAGVFSHDGQWLYLAMRGSRAVERIDAATQRHSGSILDVGFAPQGLALSSRSRYLLVDAAMSREIVVYDVQDLSELPRPIARVPLVETEPLAPDVLRGKQLFGDSFDPRIAQDSYIACAHCHLDGLGDNLTWDFTDRGEGLRNTTSLLGRAGDGDGPIHWSGNFDEIHDFEHDIRGAFGGTGLMEDAEFHAEGRDHPLGSSKAGISEDLDALAAYVGSLGVDSHLPSPFRQADGTLGESALRGKAIFESEQSECMRCHSGPRLTDSRFGEDGEPVLHDVGTLGEGSGQRLGGALPGIDTPTLHGLWNSAPYLHDGSAATLREVLGPRNSQDRHGVTSHLSDDEIVDLEAYLLSLDGHAD